MPDKLYCGIDLGFSGGITMLRNGKIEYMGVMPVIKMKSRHVYDIPKIVTIFKSFNPDLVGIERALMVGRSGSLAYFHNGYGQGMFEGILSALLISYSIIHPKTWQKQIFAGMHHTDTKKMSVIWCHRMFPHTDFTATDRSKKDHIGLTDSLCIAHYVSKHV